MNGKDNRGNNKQDGIEDTQWPQRNDKEKRFSCFCCRLRCPFHFPIIFLSHSTSPCHWHFRLFVFCHTIADHGFWHLCPFVLCAVFTIPPSLTSSCPSLWSIMEISHTPRGVRLGGGFYWPYSHSGVRIRPVILIYHRHRAAIFCLHFQ